MKIMDLAAQNVSYTLIQLSTLKVKSTDTIMTQVSINPFTSTFIHNIQAL